MVRTQFDYNCQEYVVGRERSSTAQEDLDSLVEKLRAAQREIGRICSAKENLSQWRAHTKRMHDLGNASNILRYNYGCATASQAYCKFMEILSRFPFILESDTINSFHLCEGPGNFLSAIDHVLCSFYPQTEWKWLANSLNPYYEGVAAEDKLLDDSLMFHQMENWHFGEDNSGDIFKIGGLNQKFDFVTADGSIYTQDDPENQEKTSFLLIEREFELAKSCLKVGGAYIFKCYTLLNEDTKRYFEDLSASFETIFMFKPLCSKPGNSERYVICKNYQPSAFKKATSEDLIQCDYFFIRKQFDAIQRNLQAFLIGNCQKRRKFMEEAFLETIRAKELTHFESFLRLKTPPAPWNAIYGHNLVDRLKRGTDDVVFHVKIESIEEIFFDLEAFEKSLVWSTHEPTLKSSMFIDPVLLKRLELVEKLDFDRAEVRIKLMDTLRPLEGTIAERLMKVLELWLQKADFELIWSQPPMFLSRKSASFFALLAAIYETKIDRNGIRCCNAKKINEELLTRFVENTDNKRILLSFAPLEVLSKVHGVLVNFNHDRFQDINC